MLGFRFLAPISLGMAAGCASVQAIGDPAVMVAATGQTVPVGTVNEDAADDPAIWRNRDDPAASLIVATDKKAGLYVYGLDGKVRSFLAAGLLNNVDLIELANGTILVAASDRSDPVNAKILLASLDRASGALTELARLDAGRGEAYGLCIGEQGQDGSVSIYSPIKDGRIAINTIRWGDAGWSSTTRTFASVPSQPEGCVYDPRTRQLYVGEEVAGIWRFDTSTGQGNLVVRVDNRMLVADVEGLALAPAETDRGYLVASSQGDNAFAVFALPELTPVGRFRIGGSDLGSVEETDGIDLELGDFGADYPGGLFVAQDGLNAPYAQNFKLVSWQAILASLGI